jgi:tetratricopeptide (TPR) repeat protein
MVCSLVLILAMQPDPAVMRRVFEENLARREQQFGADNERTADAARDLGLFLKAQGDAAGAQARLAQVLRIDEAKLGPAAALTLSDAAELAAVVPPAAGERLWQRIAQSADAALASRALAALGELRVEAADPGGAAKFFRKALASEETAHGRDSSGVAVRLNSLAVLVEPEEGIPMLQRALAIDRRLLGERHPETSTTEANLAGLLLNSGRPGAALREATSALAGLEETLGPEHPRVAAVCMILAACWRAKGDRTRAERLYRRALEIDEKAYGPDHPETLGDVRNLAGFLREIGKAKEAAALEAGRGRRLSQ